MTKKEKQAYNRQWHADHKEEANAKSRKYHIEHREERRAANKAYRSEHRKEIRAYQRKYGKKHRAVNKERINRNHLKYRKDHPIALSLRNHHNYIFNSKYKSHKNYKGMPFEPRWDRLKEGSIHVGEQELLQQIGPKPNKKSSLHIVDHAKGVVLGNLVWADSQTQNREKMCKIIANLRHENELLKQRLAMFEVENQ